MDYLQYGIKMKLLNVSNHKVLNLIINGLPSILRKKIELMGLLFVVLNLIINGLPSIPILNPESNDWE